MERLGIGAVQPGAGLAAIASLLGGLGGSAALGVPPPVLLASVFYWQRLRADSSLFSELNRPLAAGSNAMPAHANVPAAAQPAAQAAPAAPPAAGPSLEPIRTTVVKAVAAVLGSDPGPHTPLVAAGLDSLGA